MDPNPFTDDEIAKRRAERDTFREEQDRMRRAWPEERETFKANLTRWIQEGHEDKWVAIRGKAVIGPMDDLGELFEAACKTWGNKRVDGHQEWLARKVEQDHPIMLSAWAGSTCQDCHRWLDTLDARAP